MDGGAGGQQRADVRALRGQIEVGIEVVARLVGIAAHRPRGETLQGIQQPLRTPLARHLEGVKLGAAELRDILRGERPELSPYASLDLSSEVPQELAEDAGFSRPALKDDGEIFYDYWLWFFRHARKRAVQQRKEAAD